MFSGTDWNVQNGRLSFTGIRSLNGPTIEEMGWKRSEAKGVRGEEIGCSQYPIKLIDSYHNKYNIPFSCLDTSGILKKRLQAEEIPHHICHWNWWPINNFCLTNWFEIGTQLRYRVSFEQKYIVITRFIEKIETRTKTHKMNSYNSSSRNRIKSAIQVIIIIKFDLEFIYMARPFFHYHNSIFLLLPLSRVLRSELISSSRYN